MLDYQFLLRVVCLCSEDTSIDASMQFGGNFSFLSF